MKYDYLIVGSGFSGSICARKLADSGKTVLLIDKRNHIGGNAYDMYDANGILIHPYGPHIFHTNSKYIFEFLSKYTNWRFYEHKVLAFDEGNFYPIPINRQTLNKVFNTIIEPEMVSSFLDKLRISKPELKTSEDVVLNSVGELLCNKFFRGYTKKQWGLDLNELSAGVAARIPTRTDDDDRYFSDKYQFMPADGYSILFKNLLDHKNIDIKLNTDFFESKNSFFYEKLIYTGPIDSYYSFIHGKLPYRSLIFKHEHLSLITKFQQVGTINYPNQEDFTRITEFKHLTGQISLSTSIVREYPTNTGDPYYPIPTIESANLYKKYQEMTENEKNVYFVGRLAQYKYFNMDQVVASALKLSDSLININ